MYTEHHCLHIACLTFTTAFIITIIVVYDFHHKDIITHTHRHTQSFFYHLMHDDAFKHYIGGVFVVWISCSWKECLKTIFLKYVWKYIFFIAIFFYIIHRKEPPVACFCESSVRVHLLLIFLYFVNLSFDSLSARLYSFVDAIVLGTMKEGMKSVCCWVHLWHYVGCSLPLCLNTSMFTYVKINK